MHIIAFASQKGGTGKTTLAGHIAVQAERAGDGPAALIDTDPQGSLSAWLSERREPTPELLRSTEQQLTRTIVKLGTQGVKLLIIDTPPAVSATIGHVMRYADLIVVPTRPSPHDLRAIGGTVALAEGLGKPLVFVLNGAAPRARATAEAAIALSQHGPLAPAIVHQRVGFATAMIDGSTVMESNGRSRSPGEIAELWKYLKQRLGRASRPAPVVKRTVGPRRTRLRPAQTHAGSPKGRRAPTKKAA